MRIARGLVSLVPNLDAQVARVELGEWMFLQIERAARAQVVASAGAVEDHLPRQELLGTDPREPITRGRGEEALAIQVDLAGAVGGDRRGAADVERRLRVVVVLEADAGRPHGVPALERVK